MKAALVAMLLAAVIVPVALSAPSKPKPFTDYATITLRANNCPKGPTVAWTLRTPWGDLYRATPGGCPAITSSTNFWPEGNYLVQATQCSGHSLWWSPYTWFQVVGPGSYVENVSLARLNQLC